MSEIEKNLTTILRQKDMVALKALRDSNTITIIAVSKGQPTEAISEAYQAGQRHFGESYAQEMAQKISWAKSQGLTDIVWHFLGAIQTNKLKDIAKANMIHSLGSLRHAECLNHIVTSNMRVFLQVNLDQNAKRQGFFPGDVVMAAQKIQTLKNLHLVGLMCIAPQDEHHNAMFWFSYMKKLRQELSQHGFFDLKLSMGMSGDFHEAIACGADYIRIGTAIFGLRNKKKL